MISTLEKEITLRFLKARKKDGFLNIISIFSFIGISLGVAVLIIVMSVMNGFRTELINKIVGFNSHITVKPYENRIEINNNDLISTARQLGFQPSEEIKLWNGNNLNSSMKESILGDNLINEFQEINKANLIKVVNFIRSNQSPLIRNILDFDQKDILKRNNSNSGALILNNSVLCTILKDINYQNLEIYTLTISRYWDNRLNPILNEIINRFFVRSPFSILKTYKENFQINSFLEECELQEVSQEIILLRNTIIKNEAKQINKINQSIESIFQKLNPQGNPYPSPLPLKYK